MTYLFDRGKYDVVNYDVYELRIHETAFELGKINEHFGVKSYKFLTFDGAKNAIDILIKEIIDIFGEVEIVKGDTVKVVIRNPKFKKAKKQIWIVFDIDRYIYCEQKEYEIYRYR